MKKKKIRVISLAVLLVIAAVGITAYARSNYGTENDPLITKSYLDDVLAPELTEQFRFELGEAMDNSSHSGGGKGSFELVTLSTGQVLQGEIGCEILLRIGSASVYADDSPGLVDTTSGTTVDHGAALAANHLYMVSIAENGIMAGSASTKLLVSGAYSIY